jgi:SAM-dependent methyltransferase
MRITDILGRELPPRPWAEGEKIPWSDEAFSRRMLQEHLSQEHDLASRRQHVIEQHVRWIDEVCLSGVPSRVLDLGCGPGLYTQGLTRRGHRCIGVDFSPAAIAHAQQQASQENLNIEYVCADIRKVRYEEEFDLVMLIFGEFNVFSREDASLLLKAVYRCLKPGGCIVLEAHTRDFVEQQGRTPPRWSAASGGLFSPNPHLLLEEHFWDIDEHASTTRYFVVEASTGNVERYATTTQAYRDDEFDRLLMDAGFSDLQRHASLAGNDEYRQEGLFVCTARSQSTA